MHLKASHHVLLDPKELKGFISEVKADLCCTDCNYSQAVHIESPN